jgi:hypothetical protein
MSMTEAFVQRWRKIIASPGPGKFEVDASHPLRFIAGVNDRDQPMIFVIVADKPPVPDLSGIIEVDRRQRTIDRRWTLAMSLTDQRFLEAYLQFSADLVARTSDAVNESHGLATLVKVVAEWKRMFARGPRAPLSEDSLRGLVAELWFGVHVLRREAEAPGIALAWQGPHGSHQDYVFPLGPRYEVKSRRPDAEVITIASPEQLDAEDLTLATVTLVGVGVDTSDAVNLPTLVDGIRADLAATPDAALAFDDGLHALDIDPGDSRYADQWFVVTECTEYQVVTDFPAIRRSAVPDPIVAATYDISINAIKDFMTDRRRPGTTG